jgi:meso-butanediol dehydrogenase / (S,S)-butanediol dehydrogenase / diacetyl reductase
MRFEGKVVLITGAASGIGLAAARAFAAEGARVMLADRSEEQLNTAVSSIRAAGADAAGVIVDVTDFASCEAMVAHTVATYGGIQIAFNNAGVPCAIGGEFEDFAIADWQRLINTNLSGIFYSMKAEVPVMKVSGGTAIVNTGSIASLIAAPGMAAYVAGKHGVSGLTKAAALDLIRHGIRVNAVCPGFVDTPMLSGAIAVAAARTQIEASVPIQRIAAPQEVANAVLFLASNEASYLVGTLLSVDGGFVIQ